MDPVEPAFEVSFNENLLAWTQAVMYWQLEEWVDLAPVSFFLTSLGSTLPPITEVEHGHLQDVLDKRFIFVYFPQNLLLHFSMPVWKPMSGGSSIPARLATSKGGGAGVFSIDGLFGNWKTCLLREFEQWPVVLGFPKQLMTCSSAGLSNGVCRTQCRWNRWHWAGHRDFLRIFCQSFSDLDTTAVDHPFSVRSLVSADVTNPSDQWTSKTRFSGKGWLFIEKPEFQDLCCWPQKTRVHWDWGQNGLATWTMEFQLSRAAK